MPNTATSTGPRSDGSESTRRKQTHLKYKCMFWPFTYLGSYLQLELHFSKSPRKQWILNSATSVLICASQANAVVFFQILYRGWPWSPAVLHGWRVSTLTSVTQKQGDKTSSKPEAQQRVESSECFVPLLLLHQHRKLLLWASLHLNPFSSPWRNQKMALCWCKWYKTRAQMCICHSKEMQQNFLNKLNAILDKIPFQLEARFKLKASLRSYYLRFNCIYYVCSLRRYRYSFNSPSNILRSRSNHKMLWVGRNLWGSSSPTSCLMNAPEITKGRKFQQFRSFDFWMKKTHKQYFKETKLMLWTSKRTFTNHLAAAGLGLFTGNFQHFPCAMFESI